MLGLVQHKQGVDQRGTQRCGEVDALHLAAAERAALPVQREVANAHVAQVAQAGVDLFKQQLEGLQLARLCLYAFRKASGQNWLAPNQRTGAAAQLASASSHAGTVRAMPQAAHETISHALRHKTPGRIQHINQRLPCCQLRQSRLSVFNRAPLQTVSQGV
jgi:hypothetical protein